VGKTSVVAELISHARIRLDARKITQYGHGVCSANERLQLRDGGSQLGDIGRRAARQSDTFPVSAGWGRARAAVVRTEQGRLADDARAAQALDQSQHVIVESNSGL